MERRVQSQQRQRWPLRLRQWMHISTPQDARGRPHRTSATATILGLVALLAPQRWSMKEHYECQWTLAGLDICEITSWIRGEVAHEKFSDSSTCNVHLGDAGEGHSSKTPSVGLAIVPTYLVSKQRKIRRDEASRSCSSFCKSLYRVGWTSVWLVDPSRCECSTTRPGGRVDLPDGLAGLSQIQPNGPRWSGGCHTGSSAATPDDRKSDATSQPPRR